LSKSLIKTLLRSLAGVSQFLQSRVKKRFVRLDSIAEGFHVWDGKTGVTLTISTGFGVPQWGHQIVESLNRLVEVVIVLVLLLGGVGYEERRAYSNYQARFP
jgi:hypothetical protein